MCVCVINREGAFILINTVNSHKTASLFVANKSTKLNGYNAVCWYQSF